MDSEWKVYKLTDTDWWCAKTQEEAIQAMMEYLQNDCDCGQEELDVFYSEAKEVEALTPEEMKLLRFNDVDEGVIRSFEAQLYKEEQKGINGPFMFASTEY